VKQILQQFRSGELWLAEVPEPAIGPRQVLVRTDRSFVSAGTERMLVDFARRSLVGKALAMPDQVRKVLRKVQTEGLKNTFDKVQTKLDEPVPLGYSSAGYVEALGREVTGLRVGDRVACGGAGYANHAEWNAVPRNLVVPIPEGLSLEVASGATVGAIALQGVRQCDVRLGESVCVIGLGLLGQLAVQFLKAAGCRVYGIDLDPARCDLARSLGADGASEAAPEEAGQAFTGGRGFDAVLIAAATKSSDPVRLAGVLARMRGVVVATGAVGMDLPRDVYYRKELDFRLSMSYGPGRYDPAYEEGGQDYPYGYVRWTEQRNMQAYLDLAAAGRIEPARLISHRFAFDDALDAYALLAGGSPSLGIVLEYPTPPARTRTVEVSPRPRDAAHARGAATKGPVRLALLGAGGFARSTLLPRLRASAAYDLQVICTATGASAAETARRFGAIRATTDADTVLSDPTIDAVFICTRHGSHARLVEAALDAGKHVFVEKPLCITPGELDRLRERATAHPDLRLLVGFNRRFSAHATAVAAAFRGRQAPLVIHYRVNAGTVPADHWVQDPAVGGGRIVGEVCHFVDLATFWADALPVSAVAAGAASVRNDQPVDDQLSATVRFADGSILNLVYVATGAVELPKERIEVFGEGSTAVVENFRRTRILGRRAAAGARGSDKGFDGELAAFAAAIRDPALPPPIPADALFAVTRATFALRDAVRGADGPSVPFT
jgi:predicted dehydrogenase/threonine dehydrogenase-like Zn-dependent dehydrogenase